MVRLVLAAGMFLAIAAGGQNPAGVPPVVGWHSYADPALQLTFAYPANLAPEDASGAEAMARRMLWGEDASQHRAVCTNTLLAVGSPGKSGTAAGKPAADGGESLALFDIALNCLPPKALKNAKLRDRVLAGLATQGTTVLGLMPLESTVGYWMAGHHAFLAIAQGEPVDPEALQTTGREFLAVVTTEVDGHILAWTLQSDSMELMNQLLQSRVSMGSGAATPLFPGKVQQGAGLETTGENP